MDATSGDMKIVILTGLSGSGKSTALRVFEDLGFFCVDGLPVSLVPKLIGLFDEKGGQRYKGLALGMDVRQADLDRDWGATLAQIKVKDVGLQILFFEADTQEIIRRYATTRRPHPLESAAMGLEQAVLAERERMRPLRDAADMVLDTTDFSIHDLRRKLQEKWASIRPAKGTLKVHVMSFGFKYGPPSEADMVFDLRFLPNPYFDKELRERTGKDQPVRDYVLARDPGREFLTRLTEFLRYLLPLYAKEGRYRLTIAFGCTGGRHRSVAVAESVFDTLSKAGYSLSLEHRHIERG
ncbi:MAG: RNase adapter RapZ [Solidesulfovibrio sp.]|nr:RNase adapter RapZ [Solidesulfovibrio sp.]MEA4856642.1 RNase adapter RapZ [Solidesulfovibrio sp.]